MWKNKHVVTALLTAPVLALIAYFAVDRMVSEKPQAARDGEAYPLRVMSGCRHHSGECVLQNGDVRLLLVPSADRYWLLTSSVPLSGALIGASDDVAPTPFAKPDQSTPSWRAPIDAAALSNRRPLRLVAVVGASQYFAEFPVTFAIPEN